jgi:hypothetical protein
VSKPVSSASSGRFLRVIWIVLGAYIVVTSLAGIAFGVLAWNGWLAILYGALGVSMGVAGVVSTLTIGPLRATLLGWFLVGIAIRAILEGDLYLAFISFPAAAALIVGLIVELVRARSTSIMAFGAVGGATALVALAILGAVGPQLPAICPTHRAQTRTVILISYPPNVFPWDAAERKYAEQCL